MFRFILNAKKHYRAHVSLENRKEATRNLLQWVVSNGLLKDTIHEGNPNPNLIVSYVATELMNKYSITLGYSWGGLTSYLHREHWLYSINKNVPSFSYQTPIELTDEDKDELQSIAGFGPTFEISIFRCVTNARIAGVI